MKIFSRSVYFLIVVLIISCQPNIEPDLSEEVEVIPSKLPFDTIHLIDLSQFQSTKDNWKIRKLQTPWGNGEGELFDIETDPAGLDPLNQSYPDVLRSLISDYDRYSDENNVLPMEHGLQEYPHIEQIAPES